MDKRKVVEVEAKTIKDAIEMALEELNILKEEAAIEVLVEEQKGLFGMEGARPAKVRVSVKK